MLLWHMLCASHAVHDFESILRRMGEARLQALLVGLQPRLHNVRPTVNAIETKKIYLDVHGQSHMYLSNAIAFSVLHLLQHLLLSTQKRLAFLLLGISKVVDNNEVSMIPHFVSSLLAACVK